MPGAHQHDSHPPDPTVKADVVAWVGKLDDAVEQLYREIDRLPGLIRKEGRGTHPKPDGSGQGSAQ